MSDEILKLGQRRAHEMGLRLTSGSLMGPNRYSAEDVWRLLGEGRECWTDVTDRPYCSWIGRKELHHTHTCLTIGIRALIQENEERKLLRAIINHTNVSEFLALKDQAKALLEKP